MVVISSHYSAVSRMKVPEKHDVCTNLEPEHLGLKTRQIEVIDKFEWIYVLLIHTVFSLQKTYSSCGCSPSQKHHWWV